ncbi:ABC transporter permease [Leucobacter allii]|uniref:ABC transporter permease n=1 Tax=Leucobacter allii TaxID=2932247 RepID=UPI001FD5DDA4|nr:ABC transporter permease [Leucobacter allii]UOR01909.1 ABC transporter permease [Leucobacter allii]
MSTTATREGRSPGEPSTTPPFGTRARRFFRAHPAAFAAILTVVMLVVNIAMQPQFGPVQQLAAFAPLALAAMATAAAVIGGGIDLSISAQMTLSSILLTGYFTPVGLGGYVAIPILIMIGALVGALNGLIAVVLRLPPIVASLASMFILTGINLRLAPTPVILFDGWVLDLAKQVWFVPGSILTIGLPLAGWYLLVRGAYGRNLYAVGGNDTTAFSAGVHVNLVRVVSYAVGGAIAAVGGIALTALVSSADASSSSSYVIGAITAIALGGISMMGGRGGMLGAVAGAAVIFLVQNMLTLFGVSQVWLNLVFGALLLFAVIIGAVMAAPRKEKHA